MPAAEPISITKTVREFEGCDWVDDGWEFMGVGQENGWHAVSGWGADGWDLGDWPYVVVLFRDVRRRVIATGVGLNAQSYELVSTAPAFERAIYCEGDITIEVFETVAARERATDETAFFYWRGLDRRRRGWPGARPSPRPVQPQQEPVMATVTLRQVVIRADDNRVFQAEDTFVIELEEGERIVSVQSDAWMVTVWIETPVRSGQFESVRLS